VRDWVDKHPRLIERWFRELTDKALRRGVFHSVPDLITKIEDYLAAHNDNPKPFVWTALQSQELRRTLVAVNCQRRGRVPHAGEVCLWFFRVPSGWLRR